MCTSLCYGKACVCLGEDCYAGDGEQRSAVEQGDGRGCEKAQGKGSCVHYTITLHIRHSLSCMFLCFYAFKGKHFPSFGGSISLN